jgi:ABC-type phosphonate transport system ATPase subunit
VRVERVSRAGFYCHWQASVPRQADTALRDAVQQVAVEKRFYRYRRVQRELRLRGHWGLTRGVQFTGLTPISGGKNLGERPVCPQIP